MSWPPPDENCMFCHGAADVKKRGFSWEDIFNPDVHNQQGVSCAACHPSGLDHQFHKGHISVSQVAPELDSTMLGCKECHEQGYLGAPSPVHQKIRPSHLKRLACEACHIPSLHRAAAQGFEVTSGELEFTLRPPEAKGTGDLGFWEPDYERRVNHRIYPFNSVLAVYWCNRDADGLLHPLFLREHEAGWTLFSDSVTDDNDDGTPEVNRPEEIVAGLKAFGESLHGSERFESIRPAFVKAEMAYELNEAGGLDSSSLEGTPMAGATMVKFSISHNVAPARLTLGANGCGDCHVSSAHFFKGQRIVDLYASDGKPVTVSNGRFYGCNPMAFAINSFHQKIISPYVGVGIMLIIFSSWSTITATAPSGSRSIRTRRKSSGSASSSGVSTCSG